MAFKFFNIVKANAEISRLEAELLSAQAQIKELTESEPQAIKSLQAQIEDFTASLDKEKSASSQLSAKIGELEKVISEKSALVESLQSEAALLPKKIEEEASKKAASIQANLGQPPAPIASENKSAKMSPLRRVAEAFKTQQNKS